MACLQASMAPRRLTAIALSQWAASMLVRSRSCSMAPMCAATLARRSSPPYALPARATSAAISASSERSAAWAIASPPLARISATMRSSPSPGRSLATTLAPSAASSRAVALPRLPAAPVTMAILPSSSMDGVPQLRLAISRAGVSGNSKLTKLTPCQLRVHLINQRIYMMNIGQSGYWRRYSRNKNAP